MTNVSFPLPKTLMFTKMQTAIRLQGEDRGGSGNMHGKQLLRYRSSLKSKLVGGLPLFLGWFHD